MTVAQQAELEHPIHQLCEDMPEVIPDSTVAQAKVEGLVVALEAYKTELKAVKADLEQYIVAL